MAASCALALQGPGSVHHVKEDGVDVHLSMHCALGAGNLTAYRLGDRDRWEYIVAGEPLAQIRVAEPCASAGQTSVSPEAWGRISRNGFAGGPSESNPDVFLLTSRQRQSMTALMFRNSSTQQEAGKHGGLKVPGEATKTSPTKRDGTLGAAPKKGCFDVPSPTSLSQIK